MFIGKKSVMIVVQFESVTLIDA